MGRMMQAGLLTWILPGAGHLYLGHRGLAAVFFVAISLPYFVGLAIGGVVEFVNPRTNRWLFLAEMGAGGYTVPSLLVSQRVEAGILRDLGYAQVPDAKRDPQRYEQFIQRRAPYVAYYPASDVAQIYLAAAGLLNLLAILDAVNRAQTGGEPTFYRELARAQAAREGRE